jgi:predicted transglutaminase-like cysteine proteinase
MTTVAPLAPEVLDRLRILQQKDRPISVDEILVAANLKHLTQQPSKSTSTMTKKTMSSSSPSSLSVIGNLEKSVSTSTLAERRRLPINPEKLKLYSQINQKNNTSISVARDEKVLKRLEEENAKLPTQVSLYTLRIFNIIS